jgi:hypothetical protein
MVHHVHRSMPPSHEKGPKWCTTCAIRHNHPTKKSKNGAPEAPFGTTILPKRTKMVHQRRHSAQPSCQKERKWCTRGTIRHNHPAKKNENGVPRAPILGPPSLIVPIMVYHVHQFPRFSVPQRSKWYTTCTIFLVFNQDFSKNGTPDAPIFPVFARPGVRMVHLVYQSPGFSRCVPLKWYTFLLVMICRIARNNMSEVVKSCETCGPEPFGEALPA